MHAWVGGCQKLTNVFRQAVHSTLLLAAVLKGHFSAVTSLSLSPDGWTLLSGGRDSIVIVWNLRNHTKLATVPVYEAVEGEYSLGGWHAGPHGARHSQHTFHACCRGFLTFLSSYKPGCKPFCSSADLLAYYTNACTAGVAYLPPSMAFPGVPNQPGEAGGKAAKSQLVAFATGGEKGVVKLWRSDTGKCVYEQPSSAAAASSAAGGIVELALLASAGGLLTATQDGRLLFNRPAGDNLAVAHQLIGNNDEITDMRFVSLGTGSSTATTRSSEDAGGKPDQQHAARPALPSHLAVATNSDQIRIFDSSTMHCTATMSGHTSTVLALDVLQLSSAAAMLASAGKDATVRLWSLPAARCIGVGAGHVSAVSCVAFARRGGGFVATGGTDKLLKVTTRFGLMGAGAW